MRLALTLKPTKYNRNYDDKKLSFGIIVDSAISLHDKLQCQGCQKLDQIGLILN